MTSLSFQPELIQLEKLIPSQPSQELENFEGE